MRRSIIVEEKRMTGKTSSSSKQGRSAKTGRYVTQTQVRRSPSTTVNEARKGGSTKSR
jgi:hypothetical protein